MRLDFHWRYLALFARLALGLFALAFFTGHRIAILAERFYRYGYLVFGGGQVVVPLMHDELVEWRGYMTNTEFLTGYVRVQGLPSPMLNFAAYARGMAARGVTSLVQILGAVAGGLIPIAAAILLQAVGLHPEPLVATALAVALLATRCFPAPLLVALALAASFVL